MTQIPPQNPPTTYFNGIDFNSSFYVQPISSGLSEATANTLYLRKTFPDTATSEETFSGGIITSNIIVDNTLYTSTINDSGATLDINGKAVFTGQSDFTLAPHCNDIPVYNNDLCNKEYVDGKISSGGANFFYFNPTQPSNSLVALTQQLGTGIAITTTQQIVSFGKTGTVEIGAFVSDTNIPSITTIPAGIWTLNQWGMSDANITGSLKYYFSVYRYRPSNNSTTFIAQSGFSSEVKAVGEPDLYFASLTLAAQSITLEDRILIKVFALGVGTSGNFSSYFQKDFYSYITTPLLQTATTLLTTANKWTGLNTFPGLALTNPLDLGTSTTAKTAVNLGFIYDATIADGTFGATTVSKAIITLGIIPTGVYIAYGQLEFSPSNGTSIITLGFGNTLASFGYGKINWATNGLANRRVANFTTFINISSATTINFSGSATWTGATTTYYATTSYAKLIRIA